MISSDTIAAPSSPPGRSGRALIRVSGPAVNDVAASVLGLGAAEHACGPARFRLDDGCDVPVLVMRSICPRSYTGQDTLEILLPGNPALVARFMQALTAMEGVRHAGPGEFTARAYLAGKLDLAQAEGVAALIAAVSEDERLGAAELMSGRAGHAHRRWAEELATLMALVEAGIDFTDQEDVVAISPESLSARLAAVAAEMRGVLGGAAEVKRGSPRIVLFGKPNAGKSTLFNALLGRRRAVESPVAGTTRDALEEELDLSSAGAAAGAVVLVDLAGIDDGRDAIEQEAQRVAWSTITRADAVVYCDEFGRFDLPLPHVQRVIHVRTKSDRVWVAGKERIAVCALDGRNLDVLKRAMADAAQGGRGARAAALVPRHARALANALGIIDRTIAMAENGTTRHEPELMARVLREAADSMGELTGRLSVDDVLGRIFATFCVGK